MTTRRNANPLTVRNVWEAIRHAAYSKQQADLQRLVKYLSKNFEYSPSQAEIAVIQVHQDDLIQSKIKSGDKIETYKLPSNEIPEKDDKDWYCFECHSSGVVVSCEQCSRVFHTDCIGLGKKQFDDYKTRLCPPGTHPVTNGTSLDGNSSENNREWTYDELLCSMCNIGKLGCVSSLTKTELNSLLRFVLHRIRSWLPSNITHKMGKNQPNLPWITDGDLHVLANFLLFQYKDMSLIETRINEEDYKHFQEFYEDVMTINHDVGVFHGVDSQEYAAADYVIRDALYDLTEIQNCADCYKHSNEQLNIRWFSIPCRKAHKVVWAKQKGYSYWPAKVIKETEYNCDVRFFGGKHERAIIPKYYIKPIAMSRETLNIKMSVKLSKSLDEMKLHEKFLADPAALDEFLKNSLLELQSKKKPASRSTAKAKTARKRKADLSVNTASPKKAAVINTENGETGSKISATSSPKKGENSGNVINISSEGEEEKLFKFNDGSSLQSLDETCDQLEQVSSSSEFRNLEQTQSREMLQLDHPFSDEVEKMRRKMESIDDKKQLIKCAMECMQGEIDRIRERHNEQLSKLQESHAKQISETKKKQWCYNCEQDAIYHCCWNTAYCSTTCQQQHWQFEHKKVCRRKR